MGAVRQPPVRKRVRRRRRFNDVELERVWARRSERAVRRADVMTFVRRGRVDRSVRYRESGF